MIDRYISVMPKTVFFALLIVYGNIIPTGNGAELCPKYPLGVSNSVSGIIVSCIVTSEKLVNGFFSYFYYLGENSSNQFIGVTSKINDVIFKYMNKIQDFFSKVVDGISEQFQSIYGSSSGIAKSIIDSFIGLENSLQTYTYEKFSGIADVILSGRISGIIGEAIRNPIEGTQKIVESLKSSLFSFIAKLRITFKGGLGSLNAGGFIKQIKEATTAPFKATVDFLQNSTIILKTTTKDVVEKFKGFLEQLEKGSISEKLSASLASPVIAIQEIWNLLIKSSATLKSSVAAATVGVVQPLLGSTLTLQLSKLTNLPFDITQGIWNSVKGWSKKLDDFFASITGGGSLSVRINVVLSHPLDTLKNTWHSSVTLTKSITRFILGDRATEIVAQLLNSPISILNGLTSAITGGGSLSAQLNSLISKPTAFFIGIWDSIKVSIESFTRSVAGEGFSTKLINIISSPGHILSDFVSSITGGGNFSLQISNLFTKPWTTIKNIWNSSFSSINQLISSITGGGNFSEQISNLFTKPWTTIKNIWNSSFSSINQLISSITGGGNFSVQISNLFTKPWTTIKNIWNSSIGSINSFVSSITGGKLDSLLTKPFATLNNILISTTNAIKGASKSIFGGEITESISRALYSPISLLNGIISSLPGGGTLTLKITSPITTLKSIWRSTIGSWASALLGKGGSGSGGGSGSIGGSVSVSGEGGGGFSGAIGSIVKTPGKILSQSLDTVKKSENSIAGGLKGIFNKIPIVGNGGSIKAGVDINYGGSAGGKSGGSSKGGSKRKGSETGKGSADVNGSDSSQASGTTGSKGKTGGSFSAGGSLSAGGSSEGGNTGRK